MRRLLRLVVAVVVIGAGLGVLSCTTEPEPQDSEVVLSDYTKLFVKDTLIIVGESASQIEQDSAQAISAKLSELTDNEPIVKNDTVLGEGDKISYNLILVGTPNSNSLLGEIYEITDATRVTSQYPGENKGIL